MKRVISYKTQVILTICALLIACLVWADNVAPGSPSFVEPPKTGQPASKAKFLTDQEWQAVGTPVLLTIAGNTLMVAEGSLKGFRLTVPPQSSVRVQDLKVFVIPRAKFPPIEEPYVQVSEVFLITSKALVSPGSNFVFGFPPSMRPHDVSPFNLKLYWYSSPGEIEDATEPMWCSGGFNDNIQKDGYRTFELCLPTGLHFIGYNRR